MKKHVETQIDFTRKYRDDRYFVGCKNPFGPCDFKKETIDDRGVEWCAFEDSGKCTNESCIKQAAKNMIDYLNDRIIK